MVRKSPNGIIMLINFVVHSNFISSGKNDIVAGASYSTHWDLSVNDEFDVKGE